MFKVSKSGYYDWLGRAPSKRVMESEAISSVIRDVYEDSFGSYGAPRIKVELGKRGYHISRPRVARIMRANWYCLPKESVNFKLRPTASTTIQLHPIY